MEQRESFSFWASCLAVAGCVLLFDLSQPLGVAGGVPYILLVLLGLFANKYHVVVILTLIATLLTIIGYGYSSPGASLDVVMLNRAVALLAIWSVGGAAALLIAQRKSLELRAQLDPLTNCYNRNYLTAALGDEVERWNSQSRPLSLIMLDIDHFKNVNDHHGHQVGDRVLCEIADICTANLRGADRICRYGGEEFAIVLPDTDHREAGIVAERIRQAVRQAQFKTARDVNVTVSLGVAEMSEVYSSPDALLRAADNALYRSKHSGRNQVNVDDTGKLIRFPG